MSTHFDPYPDDYEADQAPCGTMLGDSSERTSNWEYVDCKVCLNRKTKIIAAHAANEAAIVEQMGDMASYMRRAETTEEGEV